MKHCEHKGTQLNLYFKIIGNDKTMSQSTRCLQRL